MAMKNKVLIFFSFLFIQLCAAQTTNTDVVAKIKTEKVADIININATAANHTELIKSLQYVMYVIKTNPEQKIQVEASNQVDLFWNLTKTKNYQLQASIKIRMIK